MGTAVQYRRLIQILRNGIFNKRPCNDQVIGIDRHKHNENGLGGNQPQGAYGHIEGDQPAAEEHGENKVKHHLVPCLEISSG